MAAERDISRQVKAIAEAAIASINQLTSLIERSGPSASSTSTSASTTASASATVPQNQPAVDQLTELRRRFPTTSRNASGASRNPTTGRYTSRSRNSSTSHPYSRGNQTQSSRRVGRPSTNDIVAKDVVILNWDSSKIPTKPEKVELEQNGRIISGFDIDRQWDSDTLKLKLSELLTGELNGMAFEIVKNCSGTLVIPNIPAGKQVDAKLLLKSIAPAGIVYIRLMEEAQSTNDNKDGAADELPYHNTFSEDMDDNTVATINLTQPTISSYFHNSSQDVADTQRSIGNEATSTVKPEAQCPFDIQLIIDNAKDQGLSDPVELLRFIQQHVVSGRPLELSSLEETLEGATNLITIDRDRVIESTFSELEFIDNLSTTFQVDFMGEESVDLGGPRKEWIRLMNHAIKEKYFDHGLRPLLAKDYYFVGVMIAVAMLQNGQLPAFIGDEILRRILSSKNSPDPCIYQIQRGLEMLGMLSALIQLPMLTYLLRPGAQQKVNVQKLLHILQPQFSEEGSNALTMEKEVYQMFVRYVREVAAGRRVCGDITLDLSHILQFVTGAAEEPVLGFFLPPSLKFISPTEMPVQSSGSDPTQVIAGFLPFARTCSNSLHLPRATSQYPLPTKEKLFDLYDMAFSQSYFGKQ